MLSRRSRKFLCRQRLSLSYAAQDEGNGAVAYRAATENVWALEVPLEAATNQAELNDYQVATSLRGA